MKRTLCVAALAGTCSAFAGTIDYTVTGRISVVAGFDTDGLDGATFTYAAQFDDNGVYVERFGTAAAVAIAGSATVTISGSSVSSNNTTLVLPVAMAFYPTFAGSFMDPVGLRLEFVAGNGSVLSWVGNTTPAPGSNSAVVGSDVKQNDFVPATYFGIDGRRALTNVATETRYTFEDVTITAIPAPGGLAMLGAAALLGAGRRRR